MKLFGKAVAAVVLAVFLFTPAQVVNAGSLDLNLGLYSYYVWYEPSWNDHYDNVSISPSLLVGPVAGITLFNRVSLNASFLFLNVGGDASFETDSVDTVTGQTYHIDAESNQERMEIDVMLSYRLFPVLSLYVGYKNFSYGIKGDGTYRGVNQTTGSTFESSEDEMGNYSGSGYGAGINSNFSLGEGFFLGLGVSALYIIGSFDLASVEIRNGETQRRSSGNINYIGTGLNISANLSYYFSSISTVITVGGRYQFLKQKHDDSMPDAYGIDGNTDRFYGITFSALWLVNLI